MGSTPVSYPIAPLSTLQGETVTLQKELMGTKYRVDRVDSITAPCGMASILYLGDSLQAARRTLYAADGGVDKWNKPNPAYGVAMFEWNQLKYEYVPKAWHSLPAMQAKPVSRET